jgi:hypothetical protein
MHGESIYKEIISIQPVLGKKMVIFTFDLYNSEDKASYPGYDMMVPCNMLSRSHALRLMLFVLSCR